jgi:hypothetical protein
MTGRNYRNYPANHDFSDRSSGPVVDIRFAVVLGFNSRAR